MDATRRTEMIQALNRKKAYLPCPRCGETQFSVVDESVVQIQSDPNSFVVGGPVIPVVVTACVNCGFVCQHALGTLGVRPLVGELAHAG